MARGGRRQGAGRKKGSLTKRTQEIVAGAAAEGVTPLEFMLSVLRDSNKPFDDRFKAAIQAAPYMHPRLSQVDGTMTIDRQPDDMSDAELANIAAGRGENSAEEAEGAEESDRFH